MSNSPLDFSNNQPKFPFDEDFRYENDLDYDDSCPNCNRSLSEHTRKEKIQCIFERIGGIPY